MGTPGRESSECRDSRENTLEFSEKAGGQGGRGERVKGWEGEV